jgi:CRP-like cAMP-binding protein
MSVVMSVLEMEHVIPRNRLLSSMTAAQFERLRPAIASVQLEVGQLLGEADAAPDYVYFPNTAVLSVLRRLDDGHFMAVASIGREGVSALPLLLGSWRNRSRSQLLSSGGASRMAVADFITASAADGLLAGALRRYAAAVLEDVERAVVCTRFHTIPQQFARWLLFTADRVGADDFDLTHDLAARMLGVRRATISEIVGILKHEGMVDSARGRIAILDRERLRVVACVCYHAVRPG